MFLVFLRFSFPSINHERISFGARELGAGDFQPLFTRRGQLPQRFPRRLPRLVSPKNIYLRVCPVLSLFDRTRPAIFPTIARVTYVYPENILGVEALRRAGAVHVRRRTQPLSAISRAISTPHPPSPET